MRGSEFALNTVTKSTKLLLHPEDNERLASLCGPYNQHLAQIEEHFKVRIHQRGYVFHVSGCVENIAAAKAMLSALYRYTLDDKHLTSKKIHLLLVSRDKTTIPRSPSRSMTMTSSNILSTDTSFAVRTKRGMVKACSPNQESYLRNIQSHDINFAIGPAGTGKTYLAVACAVAALEKEQIQRVILVRPAVEAGEKLGFLPGDLSQKVDPYLRPLYDALYEMLGVERVVKLIEQDVIEVAPLAYMRGRTLNDAFIIMDEGQNTTPEQMKMFLTRIGFGSKVIVTGDITQIDLPKHIHSGLHHAMQVLKNVNGISFNYFNAKDAVRHPLVQSIIEAYESHTPNTSTTR